MNLKNIALFFSLVLVFASCEEEFLPEVSSDPPEIVVEGYIEAGDGANPPFLLLTKSSPFFNEINLAQFDDFFVHDAVVTVTEGGTEYLLTEVCLNDLPPELKETAAEALGLETDSLTVNFCAYIDLSQDLVGEIGKTYDLRVEVEDKILTSSATIPNHIPIDTLFLVDAPGIPNDTLRQMRGFLTDIAGERNYYRSFTGINGENPFPSFNSVFDDVFFDGLNFEFVLPKSERIEDDVDPNEFGLFVVGDTATIKWISLAEDHFNFWNTLEFNRANQGPFSSYTRIDTNIEGGLGIWGASSVSFYEIVVE